MILREIGHPSDAAARRVSLRCPACRRDVTFDPFGTTDVAFYVGDGTAVRTGQRVCANPDCHTHLFLVQDEEGAVVASYPPETIDFDASDLPAPVVKALEEAVRCHAQHCFVAAAIMVRKTLEELCRDRNATGGNLKERIGDLGAKVVLPQPMLAALDDLRLLGNDAAHIESREFDKVDREEVEVAIDVTKEILKATYQYEGLMGRLGALKKKHDEASA